MSFDTEIYYIDRYDLSIKIHMTRMDHGEIDDDAYSEKLYELLDEALAVVEEKMVETLKEDGEEDDD